MNRITILLLLVVASVLQLHAKDTSTPSDNDKALATEMLASATKEKVYGWTDSYNQLVDGAYFLDPTNPFIAFRYAEMLLESRRIPDSVEGVTQVYELMKPYVTLNPDEYNEANLFARVCFALDKHDEALAVWQHLSDIYPTKLEVVYNIARLHQMNGEVDKAIALYDRLSKESHLEMQMVGLKAETYMQNGDTTSLVNLGHQLVAKAPTNVSYNMLMADIFAAISLPDSALLYLDKAGAIAPEDGNVYLRKARIYYNNGDSVQYDNNIYQALTCANLDVETKLTVLDDAVRNMLNSQDTIADERVVRFFETLVEQHPHQSEIHRRYSQYLGTIKDYKGAIEQLQYAVDTDNSNAEDWMRIMVLALLDKDEARAAEAAGKCLEYNTDNIELYRYVAGLYTQLHDYKKAIEVSSHAIALADGDSSQVEIESYDLASLYCVHGDALIQSGDTVRGFEAYERSLELAPAHTLTLNNYAYFLALQGTDLDKAERMAALAVRHNPDNSSNLDTYAWIYFKKRDYSLARLYIEKAMECAKEEDSISAELYDHYGDILFMLGEPEAALKNWEKALELEPEDELIEKKVKFKTYFYQ